MTEEFIGSYDGFRRLNRRAARRARRVMDADDASALSARPTARFPAQKLIQTVVSDIFQIIDLAHAVFGAVTRVQLFEPFAGEIMTGVAKGQGALQLHGACFNPASKGRSSVRPRPAALASSFFSLICLAQPAVHPARRDKFCGHLCHNVHPCLLISPEHVWFRSAVSAADTVPQQSSSQYTLTFTNSLPFFVSFDTPSKINLPQPRTEIIEPSFNL